MEKVRKFFWPLLAAKMSCTVIVKNPSDFVGAYLGQSETQTKAILANAVGKVLIIDEVRTL